MGKFISAILLVLAFTGSAYAQTPVARFIFEDAEAAFAKQDYQATLAKLDEAEKEFGKINPPILYLRIMARYELLKQTPQDFKAVGLLRREAARYLKDYGEIESVQDKAREVYRVNMDLKKYPATRAEYETRLKEDDEIRRAEEVKRKEEDARQLAEARRVCPACFPEMVVIPGRSYEIGKFEVTQAEWQTIMVSNPSHFTGCGGKCPVENVSWDDVQLYLNKLNQITGKQYRLPTEAEWEYACNGGSKAEYCGGDDADTVAWHVCGFCGGGEIDPTHPVGEKQANSYGIYDMSGNVWEWTQDCWEGECEKRIVRGGSADSVIRHVRADSRMWRFQSKRRGDGGFRLARTLP